MIALTLPSPSLPNLSVTTASKPSSFNRNWTVLTEVEFPARVFTLSAESEIITSASLLTFGADLLSFLTSLISSTFGSTASVGVALGSSAGVAIGETIEPRRGFSSSLMVPTFLRGTS